MSSILTNEGANTALRVLQSISHGLAETQDQISTGRRVSTAQDNAAVWAISRTMQADVVGFERISESLSLGQATLSVAASAAETVTDLLTRIQTQVVAAQGENVDRAKIQADIDALHEQIGAVVTAAQFNGLALLQNTGTGAGSGSTRVLASLDRSRSGVTASDIAISKQDLGTGAAAVAASGGTYAASAVTATLGSTQSTSLSLGSLTVEAGTGFSISLFGTDADGSSFDQSSYRTSAAAAQTQAEMATSALLYVARDGDTMADVTAALGRKWDAYAAKNGFDSAVLDLSFDGTTITANSTVTDASDQIAVAINRLDADAGNTIGGGLELLSELDVTTDSGAAAALTQIQGLLQVAIESAAAFGSDQGRLGTQMGFISKLTDSLKSGIGTLVDADLEETSARLQALQVQQQLGMRALSIANSAPEVMLSLFR